jgi:hypothetical protein
MSKFIVLRLDDWNMYDFVQDCYGKPKLFNTRGTALDYCQEFSIYPYQIIQVAI